jgi:hypothetical protein
MPCSALERIFNLSHISVAQAIMTASRTKDESLLPPQEASSLSDIRFPEPAPIDIKHSTLERV